jgi:hypothetical protein
MLTKAGHTQKKPTEINRFHKTAKYGFIKKNAVVLNWRSHTMSYEIFLRNFLTNLTRNVPYNFSFVVNADVKVRDVQRLIFLRIMGKGGVPYNVKFLFSPYWSSFSLPLAQVDARNIERRLTRPVDRPKTFLVCV